MKKNLVFLLMLCVTATLFTSCATIMSGSKQSVIFNSEPPDATVYVANIANKSYEFNKDYAVAIGKTPVSVDVKRRTQMIFILKEGYNDTLLYCMKRRYKVKETDTKTGITTIKKLNAGKYSPKTNGWYLGNLLFGGIYGMAIDLATGSYINLPKSMSVTLDKKKK